MPQRTQRCSPTFSSKSFIFKKQIHNLYRIVFYLWCKIRVTINFFHMDIQIVFIYWKPFPPLHHSVIFVINDISAHVYVFWTLFCSIVALPSLVLIPQCYNYYSFITGLILGSASPPLLFVKTAFALLGFLHPSINFLNELMMFYTHKTYWDFVLKQ